MDYHNYFAFYQALLFWPIFACLVLSALSAFLGPLMIWQRSSFIAESFAHSSILGIVFAVFLSYDTTFGIVVMIPFFTIMYFMLSKHPLLPSDSTLNLLAHGGFALGIILSGIFLGKQIDLHALYLGQLFFVDMMDTLLLVIMLMITSAVILYFYRSIMMVILQKDLAHIMGINTQKIQFLINMILITAISLSIKILGVMLVTSFFIFPSMSMQLFKLSYKRMIIGHCIFAFLSSLIGFVFAIILDAPPSACIVCSMTALFIVCAFYSFYKNI